MDECKWADYLILRNGGSVQRINTITKAQAIEAACEYSELNAAHVTLVEVIGEVRLEARWVDAKEQTK
jgi:hypothetical protein